MHQWGLTACMLGRLPKPVTFSAVQVQLVMPCGGIATTVTCFVSAQWGCGTTQPMDAFGRCEHMVRFVALYIEPGLMPYIWGYRNCLLLDSSHMLS